jgi:UDP-N-acetylglucosamine 4,6-dehydratase
MSSMFITGGTGSFGQAFVKKILNDENWEHLDRIVIYSRDEHKQEKMAAELKSGRLRFFIGDIRDLNRLKLAVAGCNYIVHAAALKIVPAGEYNPMEFIKTNVLGAQNLVDAVLDTCYDARVVALSTDKAVNPLNLYGASKLCAEKIFLASNALVGMKQIKFSVVRYGNVANSNGSVVPLFATQARMGKKLTVTHKDMTRYWIELDEAAEFVLNSFGKMCDDEPKVYIPDMPSFKIMDLVKAFNKEHEIIGIRPGEKIHEQIDQDRFSNINQTWLTPECLAKKLKHMGIL